jgi:vacuolar-type H+-ATPase subunit C/Vma6
MPAVDTTYIIGVLREWEKGLLGDDEFTRLIEAASSDEAVHTLVDTPYGKWMDEKEAVSTVFSAIDSHIKSIHEWLTDKVIEERIIQFISAKYDALNISSCLLQKSNNEEGPGKLSALGHIDADVLHSSIWNDIAWDKMPEYWEVVIKETNSDELETTTMLGVVADKAISWMEALAFTPLMRAAVRHEKKKLDDAGSVRPFGSDQGKDAFEFEFKWDEKLMKLIKQYKNDPVGYDPILAFWYAKELEGKNLRLLLTAKLAGVRVQEIRKSQRSLYRAYA